MRPVHYLLWIACLYELLIMGLELRSNTVARANYLKKIESLEVDNRCCNCFFHKQNCICRSFQPSPISENITFDVFMHYKEFGRTSNTGKLLRVLYPNQTTISMFQIDDLAFPSNSEETIILYPSNDSICISRWMRQYNTKSKKLNIVVLEGTWAETKTLNRQFPRTLPRVNINNLISGPSLFTSRKQTKELCVSTIEAVSYVLRALNESDSALMDALDVNCAMVNHQNGKPKDSENRLSEIIASNREATSYFNTPPLITRPIMCPICSVASNRFKNLGIKRNPAEYNDVLYRKWLCLDSSCNSEFYAMLN